MNKKSFRRRGLLKQSSALTVTGIVGIGVSSANKAVESNGGADIDREPDLVLVNNSTKDAQAGIVLVDEDTGTKEGRLDITTRGFNHPEAVNDNQNRRQDARHEITRLQTNSNGIYRIDATFGDETASDRIYVGDDGAPDDETFTVTVSPLGRVTANTVVTCE